MPVSLSLKLPMRDIFFHCVQGYQNHSEMIMRVIGIYMNVLEHKIRKLTFHSLFSSFSKNLMEGNSCYMTHFMYYCNFFHHFSLIF